MGRWPLARPLPARFQGLRTQQERSVFRDERHTPSQASEGVFCTENEDDRDAAGDTRSGSALTHDVVYRNPVSKAKRTATRPSRLRDTGVE